MKKKRKIRIFNDIGKFFKDKWKKFMELPKKIRSIVVLWLCIILFLIIIIIVCNSNNKNISKHSKTEKKIEEAALKYVDENDLSGVPSQKIRLDIEVLSEAGYLILNEEDDNTCVGYALVFTNNEDEVKADAYVSCKGYITEGFSLK